MPLFSQHCRSPTSFVKEAREENTTLPFICILLLLQSFKKQTKCFRHMKQYRGYCDEPVSWMNTALVKTSNTTDPAQAHLPLSPSLSYSLFNPTVQFFISFAPAPPSPLSSPHSSMSQLSTSFSTPFLPPSSSFSFFLSPFLISFPTVSSCVFSKCFRVGNQSS